MDLFVIEEAGTMPKLIEVIQYVQNAVKDGDLTTGAILVYGAAGNLSDAMQYEKLSMNPETYDAWAYDNIWDVEMKAKGKVVYFVPNYSSRKPWIDKDGNPLVTEAIAAREKANANKKINDYASYLQALSQEPNNLREMFDVRMKTRFDRDLIAAQIAVLENNPSLQGDAVDAYWDEAQKKWWWTPSKRRPIRDYPLNKGTVSDEDMPGCGEMFEPPSDTLGAIGTRYIAALDSYNQEESGTPSFGCLEIWELPVAFSEGLGDRPVFTLVSRPLVSQGGKMKFYEEVFNWLRVYNALCLHENEDTELTPWAYNAELDMYLCDQPDLIRQIIPNSTVKRGKGIHADDDLIAVADNKQDRWMKKTIGREYKEDPDTGKVIPVKEIKAISKDRNLGYLREAYRYIVEPLKRKSLNFDRIRTRGWIHMLKEELGNKEQNEDQKQQDTEHSWLVNTSRGRSTNGLGPPPNSYNRSA